MQLRKNSRFRLLVALPENFSLVAAAAAAATTTTTTLNVRISGMKFYIFVRDLYPTTITENQDYTTSINTSSLHKSLYNFHHR